jgi:hypothetical protein
MRVILMLIGFLTFAPYFTPDEDVESIYKETLAVVSKLANELKDVKDRTTAEHALPKLKQINESFARLGEKELNTAKLPPDEYGKLFAKHKKPIETAVESLRAEVERIEGLPAAKEVVTKELSEFEEKSTSLLMFQEAKVSAARAQITKIDKAIQVYKLKTGVFPDSLNKLTEGKHPILNEKDLYGPWGKDYYYNPSGTNNKGKMPDVWATTPEMVDIGNWQAQIR